MKNVSVREARENLKSLLDRVASGEEVVLLRRGKEVARLVPPKSGRRRLPSLEKLRASIALKGRPLSADVVQARREERY
jgi:prevent-host-death family protein